MSVLIKTENLRKSFVIGKTSIDILNGIDLTIEKGEFVSIMGQSGSGKSTLLYLLGALDKPTSGMIYVNDHDISKMSDKRASKFHRREVGFVFQFYNLVPNLSAEDNILLPAMLDHRKKSSCKERLELLLDAVDLIDRRKYTPRQLSGGQQQRVAIARALIMDPDIVLADEPVGNLDSKAGQDVMKLLKDISQKYNKTIVQVTHSTEYAKYGTRVINIKDGLIIPGEISDNKKIIRIKNRGRLINHENENRS